MLPNKILPKVEYSWYCESRCKVNLTHLSPHGASSWRLAWCSCQEGSCRTYQSSNYQLMTWLPKLGPRKIKVTKSHELWQMQSTINICICTYTNRYDCRDDPKCPPRLGCVLPSWCIFIFITAVLIYGLSHGPSKLHTLILSPGQYTRYNPIKSHNCHQRKGCILLVSIDLVT